MPTVPIFRPNTQLESMPGAKQQNNATPETFGAGIAKATDQAGGDIAQFGGELSKIGAQIQQRTDAVEAKNAYRQASDQALTLLHDPDNGLLNRRGMQAKGLTNEATQALNKVQTEATKKLTPAQREMFAQFWQGTMDNATTSAARHESDQIRVAEDQANDAIVDNAGAIIAANPYDEKAMGHQIDVGVSTLASKYRGSSPEVLQDAVREFKTKAYMGAITQRLVNNDAAGASEMLKAHSGEIDPRMHPDLQEQIKRKDAQVFSQQEADKLILKYPNPDDEEKAMAEVKALAPDGDKRVLLEGRVQAMFADKRRFQQEKLKATVDTQTSIVWAAPSMTAAQQMIAAQKDPVIAGHMIQAMKMKFSEQIQEASAARSMARSIAMQESSAERSKAKNDAKYGELQQYADRDLAEARYDPQELLRLSDIRFDQIRQTDPAQAETYRDYIQTRVLPRLQKASKLGDEENIIRAGAVAQISDMTRQWIDQQQAATGRMPTDPEVVQHAAQYLDSDKNPILKAKDAEKLMAYAKKQGKFGVVTSSRVEGLLKDMMVKTSSSKPVELAKYPGLYDEVLKAIPDGSESVTDEQINGILSQKLATGVVPGSVFGSWWTSKTTAYDALRNGTSKQFQYDTPPDDTGKIIKSLLSGNKIPSDDSHIRQVYGQQFMGQPGQPILPNIPPGAIKGFMQWMQTYSSEEMTPEFVDNPKAVSARFKQYLLIQQAREKKATEKKNAE